MGTFGSGSFENDSALDWLDEFKAKRSVRKIEKALRQFPDSDLGEETIAALEVLAALRGYPSAELDFDVLEWADKKRKKGIETEELRALALERLDSILTQSELVELWKEANEFEVWQQNVQHLKSRLDQPALPAHESLPRRGPVVGDPAEYLAVFSFPKPAEAKQVAAASFKI